MLRLVFPLAAVVLAAGPAAADAPLVLVQTIDSAGVEGGLDHLAVDGKGGRLFLANKCNNTLDVFDLKAGKLVQQVAEQNKVSGVSYAADLDMVYVGNGGGTCNGIDAKTYKVAFSTPCDKADNVYYHSGNKQVYVQHGEKIAVLDAKTGEVKKEIEMGGATKAFRVDKNAGKLLMNLAKPSVLAVVDLATNEVVARHKITRATGNGPLAYAAATGTAYVGCGGKTPMVVVLDTKSGEELAAVEIPGGIDDLHYDSKRNRLYASCGDGFLVTVEKKGDGYEVTDKVESPKKAKTSAFSGGRLYLGVPRQPGKDGPEVRVYEARPVIEAKKD